MANLRIVLMGWFSLFLFGCVGVNVDRLPKETEFREITSLLDVCGTFKNQGISHDSERNPLLSEVVFVDVSFSEPVDEVRFSNHRASTLTIEALSGAKVLAVADLVDGQDFQLLNGSLKFKQKLGELVLTEAGTAVARESSFIRLTDGGDLVLTQINSGIGMMLFIMPMAISNVQDALYKRIKEDEPLTQSDHPL